jgi:diketogulonate reductase-like aldo/keto reductase
MAIREIGLRREEVFITTKVWNNDQGYDSTLRACDESLRRLGLSYVDLYLIHWPVQGMSEDTWRAMIHLFHQNKASYWCEQLRNRGSERAPAEHGPAVNQVEFHPFLYQQDLLQFCEKNKIQLEAYSPLTKAQRLNHPILLEAAKKYDKTSAQVLIRWGLQHGLVVIPKSIHEERIRQNSEVFDFQIKTEDMTLFDSLNENLRFLS